MLKVGSTVPGSWIQPEEVRGAAGNICGSDGRQVSSAASDFGSHVFLLAVMDCILKPRAQTDLPFTKFLL